MFDLFIQEVADPLIALATAPPPVTYRARMMRRGIYRGDYIGPPVHVAWQDWRCCQLVGPGVATIIWSYFTKMALSLYAIKHQMLHLKAACVEIDGQGLLLAGFGKTTLALCLRQAGRECRLVSNTHLLLDEAHAHGVHSNIRLRQAVCQLCSTEELQILAQHLDINQAQFHVPPELLFTHVLAATRVKAILHRTRVEEPSLSVYPVEPLAYRAYWHQFLYGLRCYDLEEEVFVDVLEKDYLTFENVIGHDLAQLDALLMSVPVYQVRGSLYSEQNRRKLYASLAEIIEA